MKFVLKIFTAFSPYLDYIFQKSHLMSHCHSKVLVQKFLFSRHIFPKKPQVGLHAGAHAVIFIGIGQCSSSGSGTRAQFIEQMATSLSLTIVVL